MLRHLAILGCAFAGFYLLARGVAWYGPYLYDEADYMYAVSLGWQANAFDAPSMPLAEFLKTGMGRGRDPANRTDLSEQIRNSNDILFYRHWHGPLYGDWLAFSQRITSAARARRKLNYAFTAATAILLYFGAAWVLGGAAGQIAGVLGLILYLWSYAAVKSTELAPHQLFALLSAAVMLLLAKIFAAPGSARRYWYGAVIASALAFCVLEVAFVPILTVLLCGWAAREHLKPDGALAIRSLGAFLGIVLLVWPAAVLKLSAVKSYLFMAYLAVFRKSAWGADIGFGDTWRLRFSNSPVLWILFAAAAVYFLTKRRPAAPTAALTPFALFSGLMFLATLRVTTNSPRYELTLLPGIVLFASTAAALILDGWTPVRRNIAVALLCAGTMTASWPAIRSQLADPVQQADTILALLRAHQAGEGQGTTLVPQEHLPMVHYYFPQMRFRAYRDEREIAGQMSAGNVAGVLTRGDPPRFVQIQPRAQ